MMGDGSGTGVVEKLMPLEKTVEEPLGRGAVALMVEGMGGNGRMLKMALSGGVSGQTVAMGSWMMMVGVRGKVGRTADRLSGTELEATDVNGAMLSMTGDVVGSSSRG